MMSPQEFVHLMSQLNKENKALALGTIDSAYTSGRPKVVFDGDSAVSSKAYPHLSSYTPSASDRVLIANIGGSHVILGKII